MPQSSPTVPEALVDALTAFDEKSRSDRAARIVWIGQHSSLPSVIMGRAETLHLLNETREVFVNGHFASTLILAVAVVEHSLVEECQLRGLFNGSPPLSQVLQTAEQNHVLPSAWFSSLRLLVQRRNPYAHLKDADHEHGLGHRFRAEKVPPSVILRRDAEDAVKWMYEVFRATLREAASPPTLANYN